MKVPMLDLKLQYQSLKEEIQEAVCQVMESTHFIMGKNVVELEGKIAAYSGVAHGIGTASGSDALHLSLLACGIGEGDEVITSAFTFFATAGAIARCGAKAVFVDIDPQTFNIDARKIEEKVTDKTKAIVPVHLYGQSAEMDIITKVAQKYNLTIVQDAAQAIGAIYKERPVACWGGMTCYSFFPTKNLGAYGDGGMVVTDNDEMAEKIKILRVHGSKPKYYHHMLGYNSRLDEMQAAILNVKSAYIDEWSRKRKQKADNYTRLLGQYNLEHVKAPYEAADRNHVFHQYTITAAHRDALQQYLQEQGISTLVYYPLPLHLQPVFASWGYAEGDLPYTEKVAKEVLSLPMYPELTEEQQVYIIKSIAKFYETERGSL